MVSTSTKLLAIDVQQLSKTYREVIVFPRLHPALKDVSLQVRSGEVFGLLGPNGAGKTTLIKVLLGILHPTQGVAEVLKQPAGSKAARRKIGYLPENLVFPRHHTGRSALYFYGRLSEMSDSQIASVKTNFLTWSVCKDVRMKPSVATPKGCVSGSDWPKRCCTTRTC